MGNGAGRGTRFSEHGTQANMHDNIRRSLESLEEEIPKLIKETSENKEWAIKSMRDIETNIKEYINGVTSYLAKEVHLSEIKRNSEDLRTRIMTYSSDRQSLLLIEEEIKKSEANNRYRKEEKQERIYGFEDRFGYKTEKKEERDMERERKSIKESCAYKCELTLKRLNDIKDSIKHLKEGMEIREKGEKKLLRIKGKIHVLGIGALPKIKSTKETLNGIVMTIANIKRDFLEENDSMYTMEYGTANRRTYELKYEAKRQVEKFEMKMKEIEQEIEPISKMIEGLEKIEEEFQELQTEREFDQETQEQLRSIKEKVKTVLKELEPGKSEEENRNGREDNRQGYPYPTRWSNVYPFY